MAQFRDDSQRIRMAVKKEAADGGEVASVLSTAGW